MKNILQKSILPSDNNEGIPLLVQASGAISIMVVGFVIFGFTLLHGNLIQQYAGTNYAAVVASILVEQTNERRAEMELPALKLNELLVASAQLKANDMAENSYFAHNSPNGLSPWHWFEEAGYKFSFAGENLAVNFRDSGAVTRAWMRSPTHRDNIINSNYEEIGIATAPGQYKGNPTSYVVQHFGTPYFPSSYELSGLKGQGLSESEEKAALENARKFIAAAGSVSAVDKLFVQPEKLYAGLYSLLLLLVAMVGANAYIKSDSRAKQKTIIQYTLMAGVVLVALGIASIQLLGGGAIAGYLG